MSKSFNAENAQHKIINWLKDYATNAKVNGFVIGISGGIDSAVTSTLCAMTGLEVLCLEMPIHQAKNQVDRGRKHIDLLKGKFPKVRSMAVDLTATYDTMAQTFPKYEDEKVHQLALANTRSRLRMTTLYYFAGAERLLVAGTGNKVEDFGIGFFTKYGDGGVDLSPIADLLKSEVYALGNLLGIIEDILQAAPTDGLFGDNRTDEDQIGANYDELEWAMAQKAAGKIVADFEGREAEVMRIYTYLNLINQHKMVPIPVCDIN
jgi:NAD+ synthase